MNSEGLDNDRLRRLLDAGRALVCELELEPLLDRVLRMAQELTGATYAALGILDENRSKLERLVTRGVDDRTREAIGDPPVGLGILGMLIEDPHPVRLADMGLHPRSCGLPAGHPPMKGFLGTPILIGGRAWGNLYLTEKASGPFTAADEAVVVLLAEWAAVAIGNARVYEREAARRKELERAVGATDASAEIARALGGETDLERVLELIVKRGRALVEARAVVLLLPDGDSLVVRAEAGQIMGTAVGQRVTLDRLSGRVLVGDRPLRIHDVHGHLQFSADELGIAGAECALVVPLMFRARGVGVLAAFDRLVDGPGFHDDDERLVLGFAASAAAALFAAQSVEHDRLRRSIEAAERESRRWARELHDATLQGLGALQLSLSSARRSSDPDRLDAAVGEVIGHLAEEIATLRELITELRPAGLDDLGVRPALEALAERVAARHDLCVETDFGAEAERAGARLTAEIETAIYRTVQEALTNIVKHAAAATVHITLREAGRFVRVSVQDDGRGFDPADGAEGFGIVGMRERAELAGGELGIESAPAGTTVRLVLPAARRADARTLRRVNA
ncbi:MAG: hypothetical protein QOG15_1765 [Solirubrobacteraceae bacterium]|jgi:signal transduction histidine kinase|nr:hypothetical protein [Solirubrobacteraceae bacterium]